jgi:GntR family histidine utilization transcriptional repressor
MAARARARKNGFREVRDAILGRIRARTWRPGEIIPGEIALAEEFGCARATVNRALQELVDAGIIDRKRRAGTRVSASPVRQARLAIPLVRSEIERAGKTYRYRLAKREIKPAPAWLRDKLKLSETARVLHLKCQHFADATPFQFEDRWIVLATIPAAEKVDFGSISPNEWLVNAVPLTSVEFVFSADRAAKETASRLNLKTGEPVFVAERTTWLAGKPVTFARLFFGKGYRMVTRI